MLFENKVAVVTGAGSGIGEATAKKLASEGAAVVVADVNDGGGARVVGEIEAAGGRASYVHVDISQEAEVDAMIAYAVTTYGRLDLAVNNAGFSHPQVRMHEISPDTFDKLMSVNVRGTWLCLRAELAYFTEHGGGTIVNTASGAGLRATPEQSIYSTSKHAIVGLTRNAAIEYVKDNIRVNAVAPGTVATPALLAQPPEALAAYSALMPSGRLAEPSEIADAIAWLLSDQSSYVSGDTVSVDYGYMQA